MPSAAYSIQPVHARSASSSHFSLARKQRLRMLPRESYPQSMCFMIPYKTSFPQKPTWNRTGPAGAFSGTEGCVSIPKSGARSRARGSQAHISEARVRKPVWLEHFAFPMQEAAHGIAEPRALELVNCYRAATLSSQSTPFSLALHASAPYMSTSRACSV